MILSVSRRTDIPAFFTEWFFNRLNAGFVYVRNPVNYHQVSSIKLSPEVIDCIVFWTKDPSNMLNKLDLLSEYKFYFQITLNAYGNSLERKVPARDKVIQAFQALSHRIGPEKTVWRYDPIVLTPKLDMVSQYKSFKALAESLEGHTRLCIISFMDLYKKTERNMAGIQVVPVSKEQMLELGGKLAETGHRHGIQLKACSERADLSSVGIEPAKCIDDQLISQIIGQEIVIHKDKNQRELCGCVESIDIGAYNTCSHGCVYCYANFSDSAVRSNLSRHDPVSPMLIGNIEPEDKITVRKMISYIGNQISLL